MCTFLLGPLTFQEVGGTRCPMNCKYLNYSETTNALSTHNSVKFSFLVCKKKQKSRFKGGILTILFSFSMGIHMYTNLKKQRELSTHLAKSSEASFPPSCLSSLQQLTQVTSPQS